jgi:hypothetical protein
MHMINKGQMIPANGQELPATPIKDLWVYPLDRHFRDALTC